MRIGLQLGLAGFVAGGVLTGYLEWKGSSLEEPQTADVAANSELREVGRELGAAASPGAMLKRLRGAGGWLRERSGRLNREAALAADANVHRSPRTARSTQANTPKRTAPSSVGSAASALSAAPARGRSAEPDPSPARKPTRTVRSARARMPKQTVPPTVDSDPAGSSPGPPRFVTTEPNPPLGFRLHRFLVGQQVVAAGVIDESVLNDEEGHGKYLVYLDLSVTNQDDRRGCRFGHEDLRLQGSKGLVYTPVRPRDGLRATLEAGETARGGVAFAVYNDSAPARLLYRTGPDSFAPIPEGFFSGGHNSVVSRTDPASPTSEG